MTDILISVPAYPDLGKDVNVSRVKMVLGGSAANFGVAITKLGLFSGMIGKVCDDWFGKFALAELQRGGIDISQVMVEKGTDSGIVTSIVDGMGERTMFSYRGVNTRLEPSEIDPNYIRKATLLHISGYGLVKSPQREAVLKCARLAKESGVLTSFDPGPLIHLAESSAVSQILGLTDVFLPNYDEMRCLPEGDVEPLLNAGPKIIGVKMGNRGCLVAQGDKRIRMPAFKVNVMDTTGAGDAWGAGFMAALLREPANLERASKFANAAAAIAIGKEGAIASLPSEHEVNCFLANQDI